MKARLCFSAASVLAALVMAPTAAQAAISIQVGEPGFYGRLDLGGFPAPSVVYSEPQIVQRGPALGAPVYLRVPPGHMKKWKNYCGRYGACNRPVYFVRDGWYLNEFAPRYRAEHPERWERRSYREDRPGGGPPPWAHGRDRGEGHGNGRGHGHGRD
jgi:hypothetical protein